MAVTIKTKAVKGVSAPIQKDESLPFELQLIALADVVESPRNAKQHTAKQVSEIVASIQEYGFRDPIAVDGNYEIVEGHGRVKALRLMGMKKVPALVFKDLTPEQIRAYRIIHNQLTLSTGFDMATLATELRDIQTSGFDLNLTGFSTGDLESFELQMATKVSAKGSEVTDGPADVPDDASPDHATTQDTTSDIQATYQYVMIFDNKDQHSKWSSFIKWLKANREGETIAERVTDFISELPEVKL